MPGFEELSLDGSVAAFTAAPAGNDAATAEVTDAVAMATAGRDESAASADCPVPPWSAAWIFAVPLGATLARPTAWSADASAPPSRSSRVTGFIEVPVLPDFACVSVMN
jgi:hypothetical protein